MLDEKFILKHIGEISELRDFNEVYEYFVAHGIEINSAEVMALKDSPNLANKLEVNSQVLTMQQLDCVAGGWDQGDTNIAISVGATVIGVIAVAATGGIGTAVVAGLAGALGIGTSIWSKISGDKSTKTKHDKAVEVGVEASLGNSLNG